MSAEDPVDLSQSVDQLLQQFDKCLAKVLADPQSQPEEDEHEGDPVATCITELKSAFLNFERHIKELRLCALSDREFAVHQSVELLKHDIRVKKEAISKYKEQLDEWSQELPKLAEKSQQTVQLRTDGKDFDEPVVHKYKPASQMQRTEADEEEDDDDEEDVEFEEI